MIPWYHGAVAPRRHGTMVPWYHPIILLQYHDAMVPGTMVPYMLNFCPARPGTGFCPIRPYPVLPGFVILFPGFDFFLEISKTFQQKYVFLQIKCFFPQKSSFQQLFSKKSSKIKKINDSKSY